MHAHARGSNHAKFDDNVFNNFQGIACDGHTQTRTRAVYVKVWQKADLLTRVTSSMFLSSFMRILFSASSGDMSLYSSMRTSAGRRP